MPEAPKLATNHLESHDIQNGDEITVLGSYMITKDHAKALQNNLQRALDDTDRRL